MLHRGRVFARSAIDAMLKRRASLATVGAAASHLATAGRMGALACASPTMSARTRIERIGLQLYTVRAAMDGDLEGTLERVARIGYREVELAGYFGRSASDLRALLDRNGLTAPSAHVPASQISGDAWKRALHPERDTTSSSTTTRPIRWHRRRPRTSISDR